MAQFFIGDVHGCSQELGQLLDLLAPGPDDRVFLAGDCFDRGPDPLGVLDMIHERNLKTVMSNHEDYLLRTLEQLLTSGSLETRHEYITRCIHQLGDRSEEFYLFLNQIPLYIEGEGWLLVHAGIDPVGGLGATSRRNLLNIRTWPAGLPGALPWYRSYRGERLVVFGHNAKREPVLERRDGKLVAVGLDTGCVYGGHLTAFHLEEERLVQVQAARDYRRG